MVMACNALVNFPPTARTVAPTLFETNGYLFIGDTSPSTGTSDFSRASGNRWYRPVHLHRIVPSIPIIQSFRVSRAIFMAGQYLLHISVNLEITCLSQTAPGVAIQLLGSQLHSTETVMPIPADTFPGITTLISALTCGSLLASTAGINDFIGSVTLADRSPIST